MRLTDAALALPSLLVLILLSAILREVDAPLLKKQPRADDCSSHRFIIMDVRRPPGACILSDDP